MFIAPNQPDFPSGPNRFFKRRTLLHIAKLSQHQNSTAIELREARVLLSFLVPEVRVF